MRMNPDTFSVGQGTSTTMATGAAVYTVAELAATLRIGRRQCYELVKRGEVPGVVRVGKSIRISRAAIDAWLTNGDGST